jgi:hypothetical protein
MVAQGLPPLRRFQLQLHAEEEEILDRVQRSLLDKGSLPSQHACNSTLVAPSSSPLTLHHCILRSSHLGLSAAKCKSVFMEILLPCTSTGGRNHECQNLLSHSNKLRI